VTQAANELLAPTDRPFTVECDATDADWLRLRRTGLGASEIAMVLGESPYGSALELYARKTGRQDDDLLADNEAVYWGRKAEPLIIEAYAERTGRGTRRAGKLLRSSVHPWAMCTLDAETWEASNDTRPWPFEVKNVSVFKAGDWVDGPPIHFYYQVQHQLLVTGEEKGTIAALLGGNRMVWADVPRDEVTIRKIVYQGERFWDRVMRRDLPAPDGTESSRRALQALYPQGSGTVVLPGATLEIVDRLEWLKVEQKRLSDERDEIENTLRAGIGGAELGVLTDGRSVSWKLQHRKESVTPASSFRVLRLHQPKEKK
jgi:putative phage-type endonuclease